MKLEQSAILFAVLGLVIGGFAGYWMGDQNGKTVCAQKVSEYFSGSEGEYMQKAEWDCGCVCDEECLRDLLGIS